MRELEVPVSALGGGPRPFPLVVKLLLRATPLRDAAAEAAAPFDRDGDG